MKIFLVTIAKGGNNYLNNWNSTSTSNVIQTVARLNLVDGKFVYPQKTAIFKNFQQLKEFPEQGDLVVFKIAPILDFDEIIGNNQSYKYYVNSPINGFVCMVNPLKEEFKNSFWKNRNTTDLFKGNDYEGTSYSFYNRENIKNRTRIKLFFGRKIDSLVMSVGVFLEDMLSQREGNNTNGGMFLTNLTHMITDGKIDMGASRGEMIGIIYNSSAEIYAARGIEPYPEFKGYTDRELLVFFLGNIFLFEKYSFDELISNIIKDGKDLNSLLFIKTVLNYKNQPSDKANPLKLKEFTFMENTIKKAMRNSFYSQINRASPDIFFDKTMARAKQSDEEYGFDESLGGVSDMSGDSQIEENLLSSASINHIEYKKKMVDAYERNFKKPISSFVKDIIIYHLEFIASTDWLKLEKKLLSQLGKNVTPEQKKKIKEVIEEIKEFYSKVRTLPKSEYTK